MDFAGSVLDDALARPVQHLRDTVGGVIRRSLSGGVDRPVPDWGDRVDEGFFGPGSITWRVHADPSMFPGGLRALLLQTLHPLAMAGVADHSDYRNDPWGRLHRTGQYIGTTTFADTHRAQQMIDAVRSVHDRIEGTAPDGRPYRANDPHLLGWVHVTEVDSFLCAYQRYGPARLLRSDADRYVAEMATIGAKLGVVEPPTSVRELAAALDLYRPELEAGDQAKETVRFLLFPPAELALRPAYAIITGAAVGLLPGWARHLLHLPSPPGSDRLLVRPTARALLFVLGWALGPPPSLEAARQ
jgi:uncharacterized protein (DUF2236 family)